MAQAIPMPELGEELRRRIMKRVRRYEPDSPELKQALWRIGFLLESEAKLNVRRKGIIDTGRLLNSIRTEFYQRDSRVGIRVGPHGVPYAAMHEFGGPFTDRQRRAMFAALRDRGKLAGGRQSKGVIVGNRFMARPYMRPAVVTHKARIVEILRGLFR